MKTLSTTLGLLLTLSGVAHGDEYIDLNRITKLPNIKPFECGIERVVPLESFMRSELLQNGLEAHLYDTNRDGVFDVQILIPQGDTNRYPVLYMFDRDYDGDPDIQYVDKNRDGSCEGVEVYWYSGMDDPPPKQKGRWEVDCFRDGCNRLDEGEA